MKRDEVEKLKWGVKVVPLIGPKRGQIAAVSKVEMGSGAYHGWVTVNFANGSQAMYAGEELKKYELPRFRKQPSKERSGYEQHT